MTADTGPRSGFVEAVSVIGIILVDQEIMVGRDKQVRIVWEEAGELAVDYTIGALPELRVSVIKALPAPRLTVSDLLATAQRELAGAIK
jgi:hypothetical protein